jgi:hypothetical protein
VQQGQDKVTDHRKEQQHQSRNDDGTNGEAPPFHMVYAGGEAGE